MASLELMEPAAAGLENTSVSAKRIVYLLPTSAPYHVAVLERLYQCIGEGFLVLSHRRPRLEVSRIALHMGVFPRRILNGPSFTLSRFHDDGLQTPLGLSLPPSLPFVLASLKPEVVIGTNFSIWTLVSVLMGYPTVVAWEGTHHTERTVSPWRMRLRRWIAARAKVFVVNGNLSRRYLMDAVGVPGDRILDGGMCAGLPPEARRGPRLPSPDEPITFLLVGRMILLKGVQHLLPALRLLRDRLGPEARFRLLLVGDGPERGRFLQMTHDLQLQDKVSFVKSVPPHQVWDYYAKAHVFVLPTLQDNWPLVVPEAMSMGLPVLLSKYAGSTPDLIREGENGYSFDPEDTPALAGYMEQYVKNPELILKHGNRAREIASPYNPDRVAQVFLEAVDRANE